LTTAFAGLKKSGVFLLKPEEKARVVIDSLLKAAGWDIQDLNNFTLGASLGVAVRFFPLKSGEADYLLFVDRKAAGVIEAKPFGTTLSGVAEQSEKYLTGVPDNLPNIQLPLPFAYESTGIETFFRDLRDPEPQARRVFSFYKPETLLDWLSQGDTVRARLKNMPVLVREGLWDCQYDAISNPEVSFADAKPRAIIQMARPTSFSSIGNQQVRNPGWKNSGFMICGPTSIIPSEQTNWLIRTWKTLLNAIILKTGMSGRKWIALRSLHMKI